MRLLLFALLLVVAQAKEPGFHLTARPWQPLGIAPQRYLDAIEGLCRFSIRHQNAEGAIIDPFLHREHQYATPYFAAASATLINAGRAQDLLPNAISAMEHATANFAGGQSGIPDQHGNFFIAALTEALEQFHGRVPDSKWMLWRARMKTPRSAVISDGTNNWETYVMKGDWMRVRAGLAERSDVVQYVENSWLSRQRQRIADSPWRLYHDRTSDPDTLSVETVGRVNLLALLSNGYDGPSAPEMRDWTQAASELTMLLQDPSGQVPANGRTDNHVWVEVGYQLCFELMAEVTAQRDRYLAGQYRRAAMMSFASIERWRRKDGEWRGSYYVTKNHFDPALRIGYEEASQYSNYNGSLMLHLAEAYLTRKVNLREEPTPSEIGGYAVALDEQFATAFANAGGMQIQANLRGQVSQSHSNWWTPLGVVRFSRSNWDTRLGPSDGALTADGGVSFAPTFVVDGKWRRMADLSARYEGRWEVSFVHPLLVRCAVTYWPKPTQRGPMFRNDFIITPDLVLSTVHKVSPDEVEWGVTLPLLVNDGSALSPSSTAQIHSTGYPGSADRQNFISLDATAVVSPEKEIRGSYGDLRPIRVNASSGASRILIYPSGVGDPTAEAVRGSFAGEGQDFSSVLGRVAGKTYVGRTAAGGFGDRIDWNGGRSARHSLQHPLRVHGATRGR